MAQTAAKTKPNTRTRNGRVSKSLSGFVEFIRTQGIVGLAIGFVIGVQSKAVVDQFSKSFVDPLLGLLVGGGEKLSQQSFVVEIGSRSATFAWGQFVYVVINFIFIAAIIYFVFRWLRLDKLDKPKE